MRATTTMSRRLPRRAWDWSNSAAQLAEPIKKDKLFYFANYEGQLYSIGNPILHNFPVTISIGDPTKSLIDACLAAAMGSAPKQLTSAQRGIGGSQL